MTDGIREGDTCVVTRDVEVGGRPAFTRGEQVIVQRIDPNPQRPRYRYVVFSQTLCDYFQLSDYDIALSASVQKQAQADVPILGPLTEQHLPAGVAMVGAALMLLAGIVPFYRFEGKPAWTAITILVAAVSGVIVGFRAIELLHLSKHLPEKEHTRTWLLATSVVALLASMYFLAAPAEIPHDNWVGAYLYLFGAFIALGGSLSLYSLSPRNKPLIRCPYCAQYIKIGSRICRYCGRYL